MPSYQESGYHVQSHYPFTVWRSESSYVLSLVFRAMFSVWCSEPPSLFSLAFKASISSQFGLQSHVFNLALRVIISFQFVFRATIHSQFGCPEPPSLLSLGVQSHHLFSVWRLKSLSFHSLAFRAIILSRSGIRCRFFDIQSYILSVQSCRSQFGVQSHHSFLVFRAIIFFSLEFRTMSLVQAFKAMSSVWHSEPLVNLVFRATFLAFRVVFLFQFGVQSHIASIQSCHFLLVQHSESFLPFRPTFISFRRSEPCVQFGIQSHHLLQFGVQSRVFILASRSIVQLGIQCHHLPLVLVFRAVVHTHSGIQSHHLPLFLASKAVVHTHSVIQSHHLSSVLTFRVIMHTHSDILSHYLSSFWSSKSFFSLA